MVTTDGVDGDYVGVLEGSDQPRLGDERSLEVGLEIAVARELDRDLAPERPLLGEVDGAHPAHAEDPRHHQIGVRRADVGAFGGQRTIREGERDRPGLDGIRRWRDGAPRCRHHPEPDLGERRVGKALRELVLEIPRHLTRPY